MSIELTPVGIACNLSCSYCYQEPMRDAGNISAKYDMEAMKRGLEAEGYRFTLFGGEALLMPLDDMEEILRFGLEKWGGSTIQTNGTLLTDEHVEMFGRLNVSVGVSCEGPGELNDVRWAGSLEKTREATERTLDAIRMLCAAGRPPSVIVTLHRGNARPEVRPRLKAWLQDLAATGVRNVRLHMLEVDDATVGAALAMSPEENTACLLDFAAWESESGLTFDITRDMEMLLAAADGRGATCTWNACDPYTTRAVRGVSGDGSRSNCGRTNKDGVNWRKGEREGFERYLALYQTPQEHGGCQGCRFWVVCKGQCPGTALDGDWRNRTRDCATWFAMAEQAEATAVAKGQTPVSLRPDRDRVERAMIDAWVKGQNLSVAAAVARAEGREAKSTRAAQHSDTPHLDTPHIDTPHVDWGGGR